MKTLLRCGTLIDGNGNPPMRDVGVFMDGDKVSAITSWGELSKSETQNFVDYSDCTVVPGFIDAHVHLLFTGLADHDKTRNTLEMSTSEELMAVASRNCLDALLGGITTVRDCGDIGFVTLHVRKAVEAGILIGPRILAAGPPVTTTAGHLHWCNNTADSIGEIRKAVRHSCAKEVDFIKVMSSGGNMTRGSNPKQPQYEVEELRALVDEAHRLNRKVAAHALEAQSIRRSIAAGVDTIEHCTWRGDNIEDNDPQVLIELLKNSRSTMVFTLAGIHRALLDTPRPIPADISAAASSASKNGDLARDYAWVRELVDAGIKIVLASDAGVRFTSFRDFRETLQAGIESLGLRLEAIICMATKNAAEALGIANEVGTIEIGKYADITVLFGRYNENSVGEIRNVYKRVKKVVEDGNLVLPGIESFGTLNS
jgi:imidazolonepropionase-like amidohydrolase